MIARLLPALKGHLADRLSHLNLVSPERSEGREQVRAPQVFIGDFPAKRGTGQEAREFPCLLIVPMGGHYEQGEQFAELALIAAIYNPEAGDFEGAEMDLAVLVNTVCGALRPCLDTPLDNLFTLERDERGRFARWQRSGEPNQPRPYAQTTIVCRWSAPGWE